MRAFFLASEAIAEETELAAREAREVDVSRVVRLGDFELPALGPHDVKIRVLAFSVEHNVLHAALCKPIDIVARRGGMIRPGNTFVGEVVELGPAVTAVAPGQVVIAGRNFFVDHFGFPARAWGFDQPEPPGAYAEEVVLEERVLLPIPADTGLSLFELAAVALKGPCALHLWRRGHDLFRAKLGHVTTGPLNVMAFGGGVSELFLMLAHSEGHRALYCAGNPVRRAYMRDLGIDVVDRHRFGGFETREARRAFMFEMRRWSGGRGVQIVCDMFRGPLFLPGVLALSRGGVNVSSGWQLATSAHYDSALLSTQQITLDHMHMARDTDVAEFIERLGPGFRPPLHREIYAFEDFPRALEELRRGVPDGVSVVQVAKDIPAAFSGEGPT